MRLFVVLLAAFLAFVGITGYGGNEMGRYEKISPEEAKLMMGHDHVLVVDVRRVLKSTRKGIFRALFS